ncbi:hypothetical protein ACIQ9P_38910 [Kitasatospora sp. NPDC094019]|uniref:hypothetical protein n=1 Tax=Kitasatospora sp. NPDC094019 TaxID=3364091 RepID=UPI003821D366
MVVDTRGPGRIAIVHDVQHGVSFLREPCKDAEIWLCPVESIAPALPSLADLVRGIELFTFPPVPLREIVTGDTA